MSPHLNAIRGDQFKIATENRRAKNPLLPQATINQVLDHITQSLHQTWTETGFGHIEVESERITSGKIAVTIKGGTHYRFVLSEEEIQKWTSV